MKHRKWNRTFKLGEVEPQRPLPNGQKSPFTMDLRIPGWRPDADDDGRGNRKEIYIEEAVGLLNDHLLAFPNPRSARGDFEEPDPGDLDDFNRWILGGAINDTPKSPFDELLLKLAQLARNYNASLYRLRRLHFYVYHGSTSKLPPKNPHGDPELPPPAGTGTQSIEELVKEAEADWNNVTREINVFLDEPYPAADPLKIIAADMVEVNSYIVSIRVVADTVKNIKEREAKRKMEIPGSSSSHISLSSTFSSSSSP